MRQHLKLNIQALPFDAIEPNPWNPNRQTDRQYQAELESILTFGFIDPITVRPHPDAPDHYQIIDGEHRWRAMGDLFPAVSSGDLPPNLAHFLQSRTIPAVVLDVPDTVAKKLTIVLNETRGQADRVALGKLLLELSRDPDHDLGYALPFTAAELAGYLGIAEHDFDAHPDPKAKSEPAVETSGIRLEFWLHQEQYDRWVAVYKRLQESAGKDWPEDVRGAQLRVFLALLDAAAPIVEAR